MGRMGGGTVTCIALLLCGAAILAEAQTTSNCTSEQAQLLPCLPFVTGAASQPSASCCDNLKTVIANSPACVCNLLDAGSSTLYNITLVQKLPSLCGIDATPSQCAALSPNGSPLSSPSPTLSPNGSPLSSPSPTLSPNGAPLSTPSPTGTSPDSSPTPPTTVTTPGGSPGSPSAPDSDGVASGNVVHHLVGLILSMTVLSILLSAH